LATKLRAFQIDYKFSISIGNFLENEKKIKKMIFLLQNYLML